jgi:hypothetical protein
MMQAKETHVFEALEEGAGDLDQLDATLKAPDVAKRMMAICKAFDATAQRISDATPGAASERARSDMQRLFQGMIAARQLLIQLAVRQANA